MSQLWLPTRKPFGAFKPDYPVKVDQDNPLTNKLVHLFVANQLGFQDVLGNSQLTVAGTVPPTRVIGTAGSMMQFNNGNTIGYNMVSQCASHSYTILVEYDLLAFATGQDYLITDDSTLGSGTESCFFRAGSVNGVVGDSQYDAAGFSSTFSFNAYYGANQTVRTALVVDSVGLTANAYSLINGTTVMLGSVALTSAAPVLGSANAGKQLKIGLSSWFVGNASDDVLISVLGLSDRAFSATEAISWLYRPYQIIQPVNSSRNIIPIHISGGSGVALVGDSPQEQRATGTVSLSVPVAGISIQKAVGKGIANIGIPLAGDATVRQNTAGDLLISVPLDVVAIQRQLDSGTLSMATSISGQSKQSQSVLGSLSISVTMAGDAIQKAYANGTLTNTPAGAISLTGYSLQTQIAHGLASIGVALSGHSLSVQSGDGKPTTLVPLSGVVAQAQLVSGGLGVKVDLLGHMLQKAISNASLSVSGGGGVSLSGHSTQHQAAESTMTLQVVLSGKSVQESIAQGYLSGAGELSIDPRYLITGLGRNFDITALGRSFVL